MLERNAYGRRQHRLRLGLLALARDLGFVVPLCRPYRAKTKGEVERFNRYLRGSFYTRWSTRLQAHTPLDVNTANVEVLKWLRDVANPRKHATTGCRPLDRLTAEHAQMLPTNRGSCPGCRSLRTAVHAPSGREPAAPAVGL